ncbi:NADPH:quinone oxidoreductase family protein [Magnetospirillum sp. UT-4]|uniref:NADPH:quinone oxidoreductase family protein n=1 Tax=Magnetospirillum sp. UT-4 TaxID=2681467 RepID=UPI00137C5306|nr:NADPH:quinone oxidoreductase family protein [Magnetospirillum sp. UT-4]CAA7613236.1 NADPH:quinone reductase and related Zn-dependent oxidoreductase [Magnetospirillum sp. UT-4]
MKAVLCPAFGAPLEVADIDTPRPGPGQVRIQVAAAGVNFADSLLIAGTYQEKLAPPLVPGLELAGTVAELGDGVAGLAVGDRVMATVSGGAFAEQAVADLTDVHRLPDGLDFVTAAGFPVAYGTSHMALTAKAGLKAGETLLVHGAAGGVGLTAVEVGAAMGATVIATAGGPDKVKVALDHGAHHGIDYKSEDIRERVKALTGGRGADVVYDPVGGSVFDASLRCIAPDGRILVIGFASGTVPQIPANILLVKNVTIIGYWWGAYRKLDPARVRASMAEALAWWADGRLRPHVSATLPLAEAARALAMLKDRSATGKVVLTVG